MFHVTFPYATISSRENENQRWDQKAKGTDQKCLCQYKKEQKQDVHAINLQLTRGEVGDERQKKKRRKTYVVLISENPTKKRKNPQNTKQEKIYLKIC